MATWSERTSPSAAAVVLQLHTNHVRNDLEKTLKAVREQRKNLKSVYLCCLRETFCLTDRKSWNHRRRTADGRRGFSLISLRDQTVNLTRESLQSWQSEITEPEPFEPPYRHPGPISIGSGSVSPDRNQLKPTLTLFRWISFLFSITLKLLLPVHGQYFCL